MRDIVKISILGFLFISHISSSRFFGYAAEEEALEEQKDYRQYEVKEEAKAVQLKDRFKAKFYVAALEGFDNNVFFDSSRKGDAYDEVVANTDVKYKLTEWLAPKLEFDFSSITYHEFTDYSLLDGDLALSLEYFPYPKLRVKTGYDLDIAYYLDNDDGTYYTQGPFANLRYAVTPDSYFGAGYLYRFYNYDKRKIYDGTYKKLEVTREDHRHEIMAEFATFVGEVSFKVRNVYYFNESNDEYMDYYDYEADRVTGYVTIPLFEKIELVFSGGYQRKEFESRKISTSTTIKEHDDLMILGGSLYYYILPSLCINANYSYRQNYSNDPIQEYSGSMSSVGLYYFF